MKKKKWKIKPTNMNIEEFKIDIPNLVTKVLISRGYNSAFKIKEFIALKNVDLFDPFLMKDMQKACEIIKEAIKQNKKITIYGDYDVDGITSTVILTDYLSSLGAYVDYFIPNRSTEGYGLSKTAIDKLIHTDLIITVDCGITAVEEVLYAKEFGIDIIITDHHSCKEKIPDAMAIINPKQKDCKYPFKELAGVGVCFKLISALENNSDKILEKYSDIISVGTIADVMPLISENRRIVSQGIDKINKTENLGLFKLIREIGMNDISSSGISFRIAPRLNAAGRMGLATDAVKLLLTNSDKEANSYAYDLCLKNTQRQNEEAQILDSVYSKIDKEIDTETQKIIVVWGENWHSGVVGIVSSRIIERYNLPVVIISIDGDTAKGSARSIKGFNIFDALVEIDDLLLKYGGHELAAGLTVKTENLEEFKQRIEKIAFDKIDDEMLISEIKIDLEVKFKEITLDEVKELSLLEPFGISNAQPVFCSRKVEIANIISLSGDKHLKVTFKQDGIKHIGMMFSNSRKDLWFNEGDKVDIAYYLSVNEFRDTKTVQMIIKDIISSDELFFNECINAYEKYKLNVKLNSNDVELIKPNRAEFVSVWRNIKKENQAFFVNDFSRRIGINPGKFLVCLEAFNESGLIDLKNSNYFVNISKKDVDFKVSLEDTSIMKGLLV